MSANSFGQSFVVTTFGESHGPALGCVIDGCPAGVPFNEARLQKWMSRRRPGQSSTVSARKEDDHVEILSGVHCGRTLGTPIAAIVKNNDARSVDYKDLTTQMRPGHATDLWQEKFGHSDPRGSGRASGRETVARVIGGGVAEMFLQSQFPELKIVGLVSQVGPWTLSEDVKQAAFQKACEDGDYIDQFPCRMPDRELSNTVETKLLSARAEGESYGAMVDLAIFGTPSYLGQPVFHKLKADLASAMMSVGATIAVEFGEGVRSAVCTGSEFHSRTTSPYGGIRGGLSTGEAIFLRVAFKPTSSLGKFATKGRHDPCIAPRALVVLEAMANLVIADHVLWRRLDTAVLNK